MVFLTIVFFAVTLSYLVKGTIFYDIGIEIGEDDISRARDSNYKTPEKLAVKILFFMVFGIAYMITYTIYLIKSLSIDPYVFPTVLIILNIISNFIFKKTTKKDLSTEEGIEAYRKRLYKPKRTFIGTIKTIFTICYFVYMFYILVF